MGIPTQGEEFAKLVEHLRKAAECAAMLTHLNRDDSKFLAQGWLGVNELLMRLVAQVTKLAIGKLQ